MVIARSDRVFEGFVHALLILMALLCLFPMLYVLAVSLTPYTEIIRTGGFILIPRQITLDAYRRLAVYPGVFQSMGVSGAVTVLGTLISLALSLLISYPLSKKGLPGRKAFNTMVLVTLLF
ncbi:MAG TPA: ABC transporter permease, partial [Clostridia bacterium]|nr:ABC transporter permease [Clostridia bacterium]